MPASAPDTIGVMLVDAHAHLADEQFDRDRDQVIARAEAAGVGAIVLVGETLPDAERNLVLADKYPILKPCAGLYPTNLDTAAAAEMVRFIRGHADSLLGIGEVGLDYWLVKDEEQRRIQRRIFRDFIELSIELDLPLNVHSRSAGRETIAFLQEHGARRVLLHAFDAKASRADAALQLGFVFSIPPSIVRSEQKKKLARKLPLERIVLESDSPVLGPVARQRNEPANIRLVLEQLALIKNERPRTVARQTTENACRLFGRALS